MTSFFPQHTLPPCLCLTPIYCWVNRDRAIESGQEGHIVLTRTVLTQQDEQKICAAKGDVINWRMRRSIVSLHLDRPASWIFLGLAKRSVKDVRSRRIPLCRSKWCQPICCKFFHCLLIINFPSTRKACVLCETQLTSQYATNKLGRARSCPPLAKKFTLRWRMS